MPTPASSVEGYLVRIGYQVGSGYLLVSPLVVGYGHVGIVHDEGAVIDYGNWIQMTWERGGVRKSPRDYLLGAGAILELPAEGGADRCRSRC